MKREPLEWVDLADVIFWGVMFVGSCVVYLLVLEG